MTWHLVAATELLLLVGLIGSGLAIVSGMSLSDSEKESQGDAILSEACN